MADALQEPKLKVRRAEQHIQECRAKCDAFFQSKPFSIFHDPNPGGVGYKTKLRLEKPIPDEISVIVGDVLFQLRSALDVLACCLATANGASNTKGTYFPFAADVTEYELLATQRKIAKLSTRHQNLIRGLAPYRGGNDLLWSLNALCNIDKHNRLIAVGGMGGRINSLRLTGGQYYVPAPKWQALDQDIVLIVGVAGTPPEIKVEFSFNIEFREVDHVKGKPVATVLSNYSDLVSRIIAAFDPV